MQVCAASNYVDTEELIAFQSRQPMVVGLLAGHRYNPANISRLDFLRLQGSSWYFCTFDGHWRVFRTDGRHHCRVIA